MLDLMPLAKHIETITKQNVEAKAIPIPGVDYAVFLNRPSEGLATEVLLPPAVNRQLAFWPDFLSYVGQRKEFYGKPCNAKALTGGIHLADSLASDGAVVLIGEAGAFYLEQPDNIRGVRATIKFATTAAWDFLSSPTEHTQQSLVAKLRINMRGTGEETLLAKTRKMKFSTGAEGSGNIEHGRASVSRAAREEVFADEGAYPDTYGFTIRLFENVPQNWRTIQCAIEVNAAKQVITIIPFPGEMEAALESALGEMAGMLPKGLLNYRVA